MLRRCGQTAPFTFRHVKAGTFDGLVRAIFPDEIACFTIREGDYCYQQQMIERKQKMVWDLIGLQDADYLKNEYIGCKLCGYRVLF